MRFLLILGVIIGLAAGCGQKGPLYPRDKPPAGTKASKPAPMKPVPYPDRPESDSGSETNTEKQ